MKKIKSPRDISLLQLNKKEVLVIASDSAGGIGEKIEDKIKVSNRILGKYTARVPLMEVISVGAEVISLVDNLSVEYEPSGREIIAGIKESLKLLNKVEFINGSTEENIPTVQTGLGVTVIAKQSLKSLKKHTASVRGNIIVALGLPLSGEELLKNKNKAVNFKKFLQLRKLNYINEMIPVGSKGIVHELKVLAAENNFQFEVVSGKLDLDKSAGPASAVLVSLSEFDFKKLKNDTALPLNQVARLI